MGHLGPVSGDPLLHQQATSNDHVELMRAVPGNPGSQGLPVSIIHSGRVEAHMSNLRMHQLLVPDNQSVQMGTMPNSMGSKQLPTTPKRKAPLEQLPYSSAGSNKRVAQVEQRPWLQQASDTSNSGSPQMQFLSTASRPQHLAMSGKRKTLMESTSSKPGTPRSLNSKGQNAQMQPSPKAQTESSESVRSKMRESLAAALALVSQQDKPLVASNITSNEAGNTQGKLVNSSAATGASPGERKEIYKSVDSSFAAVDLVDHVPEEHRMSSASNEDHSEKCKNSESGSTNMSNNENILNPMQVLNCDKQDFEASYTLTTDDVPFSESFFIKDELMQGNSLSWVLESDMVDMSNQNENQSNIEHRLEPDEAVEGCKEAVHSPEVLAARIEAKLCKLFGGVNKKYKEKGRSLLFNLKDRNNPELRERVMSGEILPERLCSMTAEELASKELSEWRIAKAEELSQMVFLPDSDVDIRRLVRKTHKGEFQVEVEHEDNVSVEVSGGTDAASGSQANRKYVEAPPPKPDVIKDDANSDDEKSKLEKDTPLGVTIPSNDGTDPMQGLMTDDALKEADFLPPIVSLDQFMESLHSEPPFENILMQSGKGTAMSEKDDSEVGSQSKSSVLNPVELLGGIPDKHEKVHDTCANLDAELDKGLNAESTAISSDTRCGESHADMKQTDGRSEERSTDDMKSTSRHAELSASQFHAEERYAGSHAYSKTAVSTSMSEGECIWEGMLQLNISTTHSVISIFKSGERTSVKYWPGFLEIKGRVRIDAFEKFLQELRLSKRRAIMVLHFVSKGSSPNNDHSTLREVADSYISDERVGFAEPVPGTELYFCPPHQITIEMLSKILPKEQIEAVNAIDYGLIGIIVWRKTHLTSTISATSSSHQKYSSKKQYLFTRKQQDTNMNANPTPKAVPSRGSAATITGLSSDEDDDIPPGFGPVVAQDEDDLPEFKFSDGSNPSSHLIHKSMGLGKAAFHTVNQAPSRPVDQMRDLVHKYGQNKANAPSGNWDDKFTVKIQPWNEDDDDIPEWQPQIPIPHNQFPPKQQMLNYHMLNQSFMASPNQSMLPIQSLQSPVNVMHGQRNVGSQWLPSIEENNPLPSGVQPYGATAWRQNVPGSRGY
ncbi:uncharacterized protein LOC133303659 [Gastrolobium bilobum]|uniref:uncharacterized protein LOC133303659 n=1 Tax=Gastrolobium bilobum TaxID=150636 RepID=UPI002AAFD481|nr:uncharacterized protein LOC133303659 [Gastrolobium bilobum]